MQMVSKSLDRVGVASNNGCCHCGTQLVDGDAYSACSKMLTRLGQILHVMLVAYLRCSCHRGQPSKCYMDMACRLAKPAGPMAGDYTTLPMCFSLQVRLVVFIKLVVIKLR
eukprot:jgi/Chrzof1/4363/Cz14g10120.t1